jgi:hypothetical protein
LAVVLVWWLSPSRASHEELLIRMRKPGGTWVVCCDEHNRLATQQDWEAQTLRLREREASRLHPWRWPASPVER